MTSIRAMCNPVIVAFAIAWSAHAAPSIAGDDSPYAPQPQESLQQMLAIEWNKGPNLPQGFQDSAGGIVDGVLITACGFCQGVDSWADRKNLEAKKPGRYPRGFLSKVWGLDLHSSDDGWKTLPAFPGEPRQMLVAVVVDSQLFCWGGFSYSKPFCYKDGYRLSRTQGEWRWDRLPDLPWPLYGSGICAHGAKIYLVGGADFDNAKSYTTADRTGKVERIGARLLTIDVKNLDAGWKELAECPGAPRCAPGVAGLNGKVYALGGGTGNDNAVGQYRTVVDNWQYDPSANRWSRLADSPVASGCFPSGAIVAFDRYLLMVGGYQYKNVVDPDGSIRPVYGEPKKRYPHEYFSDVFVYDTTQNRFGTATPLPLNNFMPMTVVADGRIHLIGGETGGSTIDGEPFGHHPDLYLVGVLRKTGR